MKEKNNASGCCDGMAEMMKGCFPHGAVYSAFFNRMQEFNKKFCGQEVDDAAKEENKDCCG